MIGKHLGFITSAAHGRCERIQTAAAPRPAPPRAYTCHTCTMMPLFAYSAELAMRRRFSSSYANAKSTPAAISAVRVGGFASVSLWKPYCVISFRGRLQESDEKNGSFPHHTTRVEEFAYGPPPLLKSRLLLPPASSSPPPGPELKPVRTAICVGGAVVRSHWMMVLLTEALYSRLCMHTDRRARLVQWQCSLAAHWGTHPAHTC